MQPSALSAAVLVAAALVAACGHVAPPPPPPPEKPPITVAVIGFGGTNQLASEAENGCVVAVLEGGFRVVDRKQVLTVLPDENVVDFAAVGRALGADLIIDGGVARGSARAAARLAPRLISTHSANVLGAAKNRKRVPLSLDAGHRFCEELLLQLP